MKNREKAKFLLLAMLLLYPFSVSAQTKKKYVKVAHIDKNGKRHDHSNITKFEALNSIYGIGKIVYYTFYNTYSCSELEGEFGWKWRFHHYEGGNMVYYMISLFDNSSERGDYDVTIVSSDKKTINRKHSFDEITGTCELEIYKFVEQRNEGLRE